MEGNIKLHCGSCWKEPGVLVINNPKPGLHINNCTKCKWTKNANYKRLQLSGQIFKNLNLIICCTRNIKTDFESKGIEKYIHANTSENKFKVALLLSEKIYSKARNIIKEIGIL